MSLVLDIIGSYLDACLSIFRNWFEKISKHSRQCFFRKPSTSKCFPCGSFSSALISIRCDTICWDTQSRVLLLHSPCMREIWEGKLLFLNDAGYAGSAAIHILHLTRQRSTLFYILIMINLFKLTYFCIVWEVVKGRTRVFLCSNIEPFRNLGDKQVRVLRTLFIHQICKCYYNLSLFLFQQSVNH